MSNNYKKIFKYVKKKKKKKIWVPGFSIETPDFSFFSHPLQVWEYDFTGLFRGLPAFSRGFHRKRPVLHTPWHNCKVH